MELIKPFFFSATGLVLLVAPAPGQVDRTDSQEIDFRKSSAVTEASWSPSVQRGENGIVIARSKERFYPPMWIQTTKMAVGTAWRPPTTASLAVRLFSAPNTKRWESVKVYARYGCDGSHWSTWLPTQLSKSPDPWYPDALSYKCDLRVPMIARKKYSQLMDEWRKTDPSWDSDEAALCEWIAARYPEFFRRELPSIGYIEVRLEDPDYEPGATLSRVIVSCRWTIGGLHSRPKHQDSPPAPPLRRWSFQVRD
jgi:hypothetical protein